ncbi:hypothetical protein QN362_14010 [Actimicrobium sp. CCC2.4]|uniref:hypothetical protein n=1 Tax=Actimicrobium sp. CCC2.4 TaxID=3048606 RepID=UPI002AC939A3|nr:hypothetical protein [Actimicrobium sp. CCC2.4]MEB0136451.1 hypothetical protein [Actimicrobium sp. CCC2.4]WPX30813.1 hypothetical protein RHM62_11100 [Actimicrobium sp. CCC2.4]
MKTVLGTCIISLVLALSATFAHSNDREDSRLRRDIRGEQRRADRVEPQVREAPPQDSATQGDQSRRRGERMSADDRRALRRQIGEANNDITSKKR